MFIFVTCDVSPYAGFAWFLARAVLNNWFTKNHTKLYLTLKKVLKSTFFKPWPAGNQTSKTLKKLQR